MKEDLLSEKDKDEAARMKNRLKDEAVKLCRVLKVLQEYVSECDGSFVNERKILPLHRYLFKLYFIYGYLFRSFM